MDEIYDVVTITEIKNDIENLGCGHDDRNKRMIGMRSRMLLQ